MRIITLTIIVVIAIFLVGYISQPLRPKNPPGNSVSEGYHRQTDQQGVNRRKHHCPQCGHRLGRDDRFCPQCGHSVKT